MFYIHQFVHETFTQVAKVMTIHAVMIVAATKGWYLHQMDVKIAFLLGDLEEQVHMVQSPGFQLELT